MTMYMRKRLEKSPFPLPPFFGTTFLSSLLCINAAQSHARQYSAMSPSSPSVYIWILAPCHACLSLQPPQLDFSILPGSSLCKYWNQRVYVHSGITDFSRKGALRSSSAFSDGSINSWVYFSVSSGVWTPALKHSKSLIFHFFLKLFSQTPESTKC